MDLSQQEIESPIGTIYVVSDKTHLRALDFVGNETRLQRILTNQYGRYTIQSSAGSIGIAARLKDYFEGDLHAGDRLAMATNGTEFQEQVWAALRAIPAGKTVSYSDIANEIGRPNACRAVGLANGSNPIAIFVPCHRVIGANKSLTGYAGGIERKQWLLEHERMLTERTPRLFADSGVIFGESIPTFAKQ